MSNHLFAFKRHAILIPIWMCATNLVAAPVSGDRVTILVDQPYKGGESLTAYEQERCKLDIYLPKNRKNFPTVVWFHGGGLTVGNKGFPLDPKSKDWIEDMGQSFAEAGIAFVTPNYRLSPTVKFPAYIEDAAAAVAWTAKHLPEHGADPKKLFLAGHSAGAYLVLMLGVNPAYLNQVGMNGREIAGIYPVSGQTVTHSTVREEMGVPKTTIIVDETAALYHVRAETPPFLLIFGDKDAPMRAEENQLFHAAMTSVGNRGMSIAKIADRDHGTVAGNIASPNDPARVRIMQFIEANRAKGE